MSARKVLWLGLITLVACVAAAPTASGGWFSEMDEAQEVTLGDVLQDPESFTEKDIKLKLYFKGVGETYNQYYTRFHREVFVNFHAWPLNARLHTRRDWKRAYPYFYVASEDRNDTKEEMLDIERVTAVEVTCRVHEIFRGHPYIQVMDFEEISEGQDEEEVRALIRANALANVGRWNEAVPLYKDAARKNLAPFLVAEIYRRLGDAQYHVGEYRRAKRAYEIALDSAPDNPVIRQGYDAAVEMVKLGRSGRKMYTPKLRPANFEVETFEGFTNDVDVMIPLFEDAEKVAAGVEQERQLMVARARVSRGESAQLAEVAFEAATEETTEETAEETAADTTEEVAEETPETVVEEETTPPVVPVPVVEEPVVEEPVVEETPVEEPIQPAAPGDEVVEETTEEVVEETTEETAEEVVEETTEEVAEETTEEVTEETTEETATDTTEEVAEESPETVTEETTEEVAEETTEETATDTTEEVTEETPETVTEESTEEATETPVEDEGKQAAAPAEETTEEATDEDGNAIPVVVFPIPAGDPTDTPGAAPTAEGDAVAVVEETTTEEAAVVEAPLPRLPFFGCEEVTDDDFRAILEEIQNNPED